MKESGMLLLDYEFSSGRGFSFVYLDDVDAWRQVGNAKFSWTNGGLKDFFAQNVKDDYLFVGVVFWGYIYFAIAHGVWVQV